MKRGKAEGLTNGSMIDAKVVKKVDHVVITPRGIFFSRAHLQVLRKSCLTQTTIKLHKINGYFLNRKMGQEKTSCNVFSP